MANNTDLDTIEENCYYGLNSENLVHAPSALSSWASGLFFCYPDGGSTSGAPTTQLIYTGTTIYTRNYWAGTWTSWSEVAVNIPSFYKDYNSLNALSVALGTNGLLTNGIMRSGSVPANSETVIQNVTGGILII